MELADQLASIAAERDFSGVVVAGSGHDGRQGRRVELVHGHADRANHRPNTIDTRFAVASATKGLTALAVASLIETGELSFDTTLRSLLGDELPRVDPAVTVEDLLGHTSGVGDYLDEDEPGDVDDVILDVPADRLDEPDAYLPLLAAPPQADPPGTRFKYNNGAYVMLSIAVERATGSSFYDVVERRVLRPAGMRDTGFFRSDHLPGRVALGYLANGRTNVFHLPVRGAGDGGAFATVGDVDALWRALFGGRIVSAGMVDRLTAPRSDAPAEAMRYGLGFWLTPDRPTVVLEGMDAGVSFRSAHDPATGAGYTVISNTSRGAWPLARVLDERFAELSSSSAGRPHPP